MNSLVSISGSKDEELSVWNCNAAGIVAASLFHGQKIDAALALCRQAAEDVDTPFESLETCLWVATTVGQNDIALSLTLRLAAADPENGYWVRLVSSLYQQQSDFSAAVIYARRASALDLTNPEYALNAGALLNASAQWKSAIRYLLIAVHLEPDRAETYHQLAYAAQQLNRLDLAAKLAVSAYRLESTSSARALYAAHLLAQQQRWQDAVDLLRIAAADVDECGIIHRTISGFLVQMDEILEAVTEIEAAIAANPTQAEPYIHHASLLLHLNDTENALAALEKAISIDPQHLQAKRLQLEAYIRSGEFYSAIHCNAELLYIAPKEEDFARMMLHVLTLKFESGPPIGSLAEIKALQPARRKGLPPNFGDAWRTQSRVIAALLVRDMQTRYSESKFGYAWALIEPMIHIGVLALVFQVTMHGMPPIGNSFFFFYFTGIIPFHMLVHTQDQVSHAVQHNMPLFQLRDVTALDTMIARSLLELGTEFTVGIIFIAAFLAFGVKALPHDYLAAFSSLLVAWLLGLGMGMISAVISMFTTAWDRIWGIAFRFLYFASGIFYVPGAMPEMVRGILSWNPLLHCVDWFRTSIFSEYHPQWLMPAYPLAVALLLLLIGLVLQHLFRFKLREPLI